MRTTNLHNSYTGTHTSPSMSSDRIAIGFFVLVAIIVAMVAYWFGILTLFFYGALANSSGMIVVAAILTPLPCIAIGLMRWREHQHLCVAFVASVAFPRAI